MIPPKVRLAGDEKKAESLRAFALSQLRILHNAMKFQNLEQDARRISFEDGSYVTLKSTFGQDTIDIYVPLVVEKEVPVEVPALPTLTSIKGGVFGMRAGPIEVTPCYNIPELVWEEGNLTELGRMGAMQFTVRGGVPAIDPALLIGVDARYFWRLEGGSGYWFNEAHTEIEQTSVINIRGGCEGGSGWDQVECEANGGVWTFAGSRVLVYTDQWICDPVVLKVTDICSSVNDTEIEMEIAAMDDLAFVSEFGPQLPCRYGIALVLEIEYGKPPFHWESSNPAHAGFIPVVDDCTGKTAEYNGEERVVGLCIDDLDCGEEVEITVVDGCAGEISMDIEAVPPLEAVTWDDANSDDTIDPSGTATVCVSGGRPPYEWFVAEAGFYLAAEKTSTPCNTLHADGVACGSVTITVFDCCGEMCTGYVRNTGGSEWSWVSDDDVDPCWAALNCLPDDETCPETASEVYTCEVVTGNTKKIYSFKWLACGSDPCYCECDMGDPPCWSPVGDCKAYKSSNYEWICA